MGILYCLLFVLVTLCRLRVLCFHNAGNAEDMFTSEGTGVRRIASPLLVGACRPHHHCVIYLAHDNEASLTYS